MTPAVQMELIEMLKITESFENGNTVRLRIDGTLTNDAYGGLAEACMTHRDRVERTVILDLAGVDFMNDQVARGLIGMSNEKLRIINCSPFIATLLETIAKEKLAE